MPKEAFVFRRNWNGLGPEIIKPAKNKIKSNTYYLLLQAVSQKEKKKKYIYIYIYLYIYSFVVSTIKKLW